MMEIVSGAEPLPQRYALCDHGDFLRLQWPPGARIEAEDIRSSISAVIAASPRGKRPLLVEIGPLERISPEARQLLLEDTCSARTAVVGVDDVGRVLTAFNYRSTTLSRYFAEKPAAVAWLTEDIEPGEAFNRS